MKRYIRSSYNKDEVLQIARTTADMEQLKDIIEDDTYYNYLHMISSEIAKNPNLTNNFIDYVISVPEYRYKRVRYKLMQSPSISIDILRRMVNSDDLDTRQSAATSPYLTLDLMKKLSKDKYPSVRHAVSQNPKFPESLIRDLYAEDKSCGYYLTFNENTPIDVLEEILEDPDSDADDRKAARKAMKRKT